MGTVNITVIVYELMQGRPVIWHKGFCHSYSCVDEKNLAGVSDIGSAAFQFLCQTRRRLKSLMKQPVVHERLMPWEIDASSRCHKTLWSIEGCERPGEGNLGIPGCSCKWETVTHSLILAPSTVLLAISNIGLLIYCMLFLGFYKARGGQFIDLNYK